MSGRPEIHGVNPYVRECRSCGHTLPLGRFPRRQGNRRGSRCGDCESAYRKRRTRKQRNAERDRKLQRRYGITSAEYTAMARAQRWRRSEEHTSELQSRENLVCRLLLEKKKKKQQNKTRTT